MRALYEWSRRHPYGFDIGLVGLLVLLFIQPALLYGRFPPALWPISIGLIAPLIWRRRHPVIVFTVVSLACAAQLPLINGPLGLDVGFLLALYALSAYTDGTAIRVAGLGVGVLAAVLATLRWAPVEEQRLPYLAALGATVAFTWVLGDRMRTRRAYVGELEQRAQRLEREHDQQARIARSAERARIAREMHDVVAHSLAIVVAQADGGRYAAESDPATARRTLETIGATGRDALAEMRRLLGVLKSESAASTEEPEPPAEHLPQPGLADLSRLLADVRASGLPVKVTVEGEQRPLDVGVELAAYRIVQEALTNALKHAGPDAEAWVRLNFAPDELLIAVEDDGRGASVMALAVESGSSINDRPAGHGLDGMAERVALFGGTLRTGPRTGGGFAVDARLPLEPERASVI